MTRHPQRRKLRRTMTFVPDTVTRRFADRRAAGRELAARLRLLGIEDPIVFGLARGGVPVAYEVAEALGAPLDVLVVRKIGAPSNPELGIGAVAEGDVRVLDPEAVRRMLVSVEELDAAIARARREVEARVERYRGGRPPLDARGRTAIVVDDGLATGGTARAALRSVRRQGPRRLALAVPVGAPEAVHALRDEADLVVCLLQPEAMWAVGLWYEHFDQTADAEITQLLAGGADDPPPPRSLEAREVRVPVAEIVGDLVVPKAAAGLVVFAHGSGSSRFSSRNRQVARAFNQRGLATLLLDLLRLGESATAPMFSTSACYRSDLSRRPGGLKMTPTSPSSRSATSARAPERRRRFGRPQSCRTRLARSSLAAGARTWPLLGYAVSMRRCF